MTYTAKQYDAQLRVTLAANRANTAGVCVICGKPQAMWPSGVQRITCGSEYCFLRWVAPHQRFPDGKRQAEQHGSGEYDDL